MHRSRQGDTATDRGAQARDSSCRRGCGRLMEAEEAGMHARLKALLRGRPAQTGKNGDSRSEPSNWPFRRISNSPGLPLRVNSRPSGRRTVAPLLRVKRPKRRAVANPLNRTVRSLFTPPERRFFEPEPLRTYPKPLNYRTSKWLWFGCLGESGPRETKNGPKWGYRGVRWFGQFAGNGHIRRVSDR
jgi:hypothetical protein